MRLLIVMTALLASLASARSASAQACCSATTGGQVGYVGPCRKAVLALSSSWEHTTGFSDRHGDYRRLSSLRADDVVSTLSGGFRFADGKLQLGAALPVRVQRRDSDTESPRTRAGLGDASLAFYWSPIQGTMVGPTRGDPATYVPFLDLYVGTKAPTGRATDEARDALAADVRGNGVWELVAGLKLTQFLTYRHALALSFGWNHGFPGQGETDYRAGEGYMTRLAWLHIPNLFWSWGLSTAMIFTGPAHKEGNSVSSTQSRRTQLAAFVTRALVLPSWELTASVATDALFDGGGRNLPFAGTTATLAIQWNHM